MKIIVGLGNPGPRYRNTRHNVGFTVLDRLAEALGVEITRERHEGLLASVLWHGMKVLLVKPMTFMNRSGDCVAAVVRNRIESASDLLVVMDDVNLPLGKLRIRAGGSAGGHNGLKSIIERFGSEDFHRLRLGVGNERDGADLAGHVLSRFRPEERPEVEQMIARAVAAVGRWVEAGVEQAMTEFN